MKDNSNSRFSYIEVAVTAMILAIIAVVIIPRFTEASIETKVSGLVEGLETMRTQISLYKVQHNDELPGAGSATFQQAMTQKTDSSGALNITGTYGPYVRKIPANPFNDLDTIEIEAGDLNKGSGNCGWHFNRTTGVFYADTDAHAEL